MASDIPNYSDSYLWDAFGIEVAGASWHYALGAPILNGMGTAVLYDEQLPDAVSIGFDKLESLANVS